MFTVLQIQSNKCFSF